MTRLRKITASVCAAAMVISGAAVYTHADGRKTAIDRDIDNKNEIHILYNDLIVEYEDVKPVNTDGRVMIPFRAALENMGANVSYNDSERLVSAEKNGIVVSFTLMDDTIYINDNGVESTLAMDVPMIIVDDRTLVPIRFLSEAFGMQVGWDGDTETVVIMDYDEYFEKFRTSIAPNLVRLTELASEKYNKSSIDFDIDFKAVSGEKTFSAASKGDMSATVKDNAAGAHINADLDSTLLSVDNSTANIIYRNGIIYVQSDAVKKIAASSGNALIQTASVFMGNDTWYSIDVTELLHSLDIDEVKLNMIESILTLDQPEDLVDILRSSVTTDGDAVLEDALTLAAVFDEYEAFDEYINISYKPDGGFSVSINLGANEIAQIMTALTGTAMDAGEFGTDNVSVKIDSSTSSQNVSINADLTHLGINGINYAVKLSYSESDLKDETVTVSGAPKSSRDVTDIVAQMLIQQ